MPSFLAALLAISLIGAAVAQVPSTQPVNSPQPSEILRRAAEALRKPSLLRYHVEFTTSEKELLAIRGYVLLTTGPTETGSRKYRFDGTIARPPAAVRDVKIVADGKMFTLLDEQAKTVHRAAQPQVLGPIGRELPRLLLPDVLSAPTSQPTTAPAPTLVGTTSLGGEECYEIRSVLSPQRTLIRFISTKDYLPRRIQHIDAAAPASDDNWTLTLSEFSLDPAFFVDPFKLDIPEGYRASSETAP